MHLCGFSRMWVSMCLFRCAAWPKVSPHSAHLCTSSPLWVIMCLFRYPAWANDFWHFEQMWILSPLGRRKWRVISLCFGVEHSARWRLLNWEIWNFLVPVDRLLPLLLFNVYGELSNDQLFLTLWFIQGKNVGGMDWAISISKSLLIQSIIIHDHI